MKRRPTIAMLGAVVALTLAACASDPTTTQESTGTDQSSQDGPALDATSAPPWAAPTDDVPARVASAGLDLGPMGMAEHYHPRLRILISGNEVPVPPNIGIDPDTGAMSAVHTHEGDGTIHIEAGTSDEVFTLGQFFTEWGVKLTPYQVGGVRAKPGQQVTLTSNGEIVKGNPNDLRLEPDQQVELTLR